MKMTDQIKLQELYSSGYFAKKNPSDALLPDRNAIASMKKAEVVEWLEAHGAETKGKVGDLRARLTAIMFVDG